MKSWIKSFINSIIRGVSFLWFQLPRSVVRGMGALVGFLWIDLFRIRRDVVADNMKIAFPEWTEAERWRVGRASVYNMGRGFFELFTVPHLDQKWLDRTVDFHGLEIYQTALAKEKGVLLMSLHLGNGDVGTSALVMKGYPVSIITKLFRNKFVNDLWFTFRGAKGVRYIDAHGPSNAFDILKTLKRKEGLIFVVDQFMGRPFGIPTKFFGRETGTAYGLALFALKTRAPVLPLYTYEGADQRMHVVFGDEVFFDDLVTPDKEATMLAMTQRFNDKIESIIRQHPEQWMWVHRRWKEYE
ncbi:MAG: lysophospholipid acyltransferase family protein [Bdellovibrionaceae bacterium]|nr:lysophospholipid acyltransferase family protein [Pseudobdellovibrionaceae bacterium]